MDRDFLPTRAAGLSRLHEFIPRSGRAYASGRNHDTGGVGRGAVSVVSPYLRPG
jgi:deoxyribodipyrimidine photo-lyase